MGSGLPLIPKFMEAAISRFANKRLPAISNQHTILSKNLYILPGKQGVVFFVVLLLVLVGAINYQNNAGFMLSFLLGGLGFLTMIYTHLNLYQLNLRVTPLQYGFVGDTIFFPLSITQPANKIRPSIALQAEQQHNVYFSLMNEPSVQCKVPVIAKHRGYLHLPRIKVYSEFPLGLFYAWSWVKLDARCLIYPAPDKLHYPLGNQAQQQSGAQSQISGDDDFSGIRQYQPGDPPSHLAWKAIAKTNQLQTQLYHREVTHDISIDWSQLDTRFDTEKKLSILCRMVLDAHKQGISYAFSIPGFTLAANTGSQHQHQCLKQLALFDLHDDLD